ncbi:MAG: MFS transporter [Pseudomonadota bacterium]
MTSDAEADLSAWRAMLGPCLAMILAALGISIAAVTLPTLAVEFDGGQKSANLVVSVYILAITAAIVPMGRTGDVVGSKAILLGGFALFVAGAVGSGVAPNLFAIILARFVQGLGAAAMMAMPLAQVREVIQSDRVGRWMGLLGMMSAIGTALGPTLGGLLVDVFGWRMVFWFQVPLAVLGLTLAAAFLPDRSKKAFSASFDVLSAIFLALALAAMVLFLTELREESSRLSVVFLGLFALATAAFIRMERRLQSPIIPLDVFRDDDLIPSFCMNGIISLIMMTVLVIGPFFLVFGEDLSGTQMGLVMSVGPISSALSGVPAGRATEHFGASTTLLAGLLQVVVGVSAMALLPLWFGVAGFIISFVILAPGYQLFLAALNTSVMMRAKESERGTISGLLNLSRNLGFVIGATMASTAFSFFITEGDVANAAQDSVRTAMASILAFCALLALAAALLALSTRHQGRWRDADRASLKVQQARPPNKRL